MQTRRCTHLPGLTLAVLLTMLVGSVGADDRRKLEGTWDVTLRFPKETCDRPECGPCPGGGPDIPIPTLNTFLKGGGMVWSGGSLFVGPGQGSWERLGHHQFEARFKFLVFNPNGSRRASEELTKDISLIGPDTFEATTTYDYIPEDPTQPTGRGCRINETAERFE
jgi:hypothetical protein